MVRLSSQKERKKEIGDGVIGDWRGGGGDGDGCVGLSQGKGDGETGRQGRKKMRERKISLFLILDYHI